jgi:hypothetical protein
VKSRTTKRFRDALARLPATVQVQAREAYGLFKQDPDHPSLRFRPIQRTQNVYSARVGKGYRALGVRDGDEVIWFCIGSHADYDRLIDQL